MSKEDAALDNLKNGYNWAQAVLSAFGPVYGLNEDLCLKVAAAFGGGMGLPQGFCGAVTGAFMIIGLKYGGNRDRELDFKVNQYTRDFINEFKKLNKYLTCKELLGIDISTMDGAKEAFDKKIFETKCPDFIRDSVRILETILKTNENK